MWSSIKKALKQEPGDAWQIRGKLVTHQIFSTRKNGTISHLLILLLADEEGDVIEIKNWSEKKSFTVYRKFKPNQPLLVSGTSYFKEPNRNFSMAKCETYSRWWADRVEDFRLNNYIHCISNIDQYYNKAKKPASVVGVLEQFFKGPVKKAPGGKITTQGYYVMLTDDAGHLYQVLVWQAMCTGRRFSLTQAILGSSIVLIPYAREQEERYRALNPDTYILTSTYPPVVDSECVNPKIVRSLKSARQSFTKARPTVYNPTCQTNGVIYL